MEILNSKIQIGVRKFENTFLDGSPSEIGEEPIMAPAYSSEVYATENPWYDSKLDLLILRFKDGRVLETYVQAEPWSGGPNTFMALRDHETKEPIVETLWDKDTIDSC
jgi:hypothetical protein